MTEVDTELNTKQDITVSKAGDGTDLFYSPTVLSKVIGGTNIDIARIVNVGQSDDGQIKFDFNESELTTMTNFYNKTEIETNIFTKTEIQTLYQPKLNNLAGTGQGLLYHTRPEFYIRKLWTTSPLSIALDMDGNVEFDIDLSSYCE